MYSTALLFALSGVVAVTAAPLRRDTGTKNVFAHHMVGFTAPYTAADWTEDITLAHAAGIDGFALNIGTDSFQSSQVAAAYVASISIEYYRPLTVFWAAIRRRRILEQASSCSSLSI